MNTSLTVRKSFVLTLAVLVIFLAAAAFLNGSQHPAASVIQQVSNLTGVSPDSGAPTLVIPGINPRVRFAPLGGRKTPAALDGRKTPAMILSGRKTPASMLDGRKTPATMLDGRKTPASMLDGRRTPATMLGGRKTPASMLGGRKTPASMLDGRRTPATMLGGRKPPPAALANPFTAQTAHLTLVDGLILLALAALLLVPTRKAGLQCK